MNIKTLDKAVKGDATNKKIKQIIMDLYTSQPAYLKILKSMKSFLEKYSQQSYIASNVLYLDSEGEFSWEIYGTGISTWGIPTAKKDKIENIPLNEAFYLLPPFLSGSEYRTLKKINNTKFRVQDIQKKYNISNVTIKARLSPFFGLERIFEGKIWYLNLTLRYEIMVFLAFYEAIESYSSWENNFFKDFFINFSAL